MSLNLWLYYEPSRKAKPVLPYHVVRAQAAERRPELVATLDSLFASVITWEQSATDHAYAASEIIVNRLAMLKQRAGSEQALSAETLNILEEMHWSHQDLRVMPEWHEMIMIYHTELRRNIYAMMTSLASS